MGNARGHLTQCGHLAGLDQLLLYLQVLSDIAGCDQKDILPQVFYGRDSYIDKKDPALFGKLLSLVYECKCPQ